MKLYLHIGTHKTGTTAVQHFLTANREALREQRVLYPLAGRPPREAINHGQHMLAWAMTRPPSVLGRRPDIVGAWDALREELEASDCESVVISSEEFDVLREPGQFAALTSYLDGYEVKIVVYLRRQDDFLHSYYCTDVLFHGESRDFEDYRKTLKTGADYELLLQPWEEAFGQAALVVRTYEREGLHEGDVVSDLCAQAGIDVGAGLARNGVQRSINRAYPRNVINCILWARREGMAEQDIASLRGLFTLAYQGRKSDADYLSPSQRSRLLREFRGSNQAVARRYLGREKLFSSLSVGDDEEWNERYQGEFADLIASVSDAREALGPGPQAAQRVKGTAGGARRGRGGAERAA